MPLKKVIIIGAGPAGIFAAHELAGKADVTVIDKGRDIEKRNCPREKSSEKSKCYDCNPCNIHCGIGGAGLMSDGKLLFHTKIGNNLNEIISDQKNQEIIDKVEGIFSQYGINPVERNQEKIRELKTRALQNNIDFIYSKQAHIGSDKLPELMEKIISDLKSRGINFVANTEIKTLEKLKDCTVLLALGRGGHENLENILKENSIEYSYRPTDIGIRVEVPREITDEITDITRDMKFYLRSKTFNDVVRTFCVNPGGSVCQETHDGFVLVNGYSNKKSSGPNTNFAILTTIPLEDSNNNSFARRMAELGYDLRKGKKITMQRLGDLKKGRKSKPESQYKHNLQPTLKEAEWGDISLTLVARHYVNIIDAIEALNKIIPGLENDSTILYSPEIKFHGLRIKTDSYLQAAPNIYVAGDGAGFSRGIIGAAASGILAARGILRDL